MSSLLQTFSLTEADAVMIPLGTVLFFCLYRALSTRLFAPLVGLIEDRERQTTGAELSSHSLQEKAQEVRNAIEVRTLISEAEAQTSRTQILDLARAEVISIISAAERAAANILQEKRADLEGEYERIREHTMHSVEEVAHAVATRVREPSDEFFSVH
jgi:F0F1-type ATP synthase membrane subunit b/b'